MYLIVSFDTFFSWRWFNNRSISAKTTFWSNFSNTGFFGPIARVSNIYHGDTRSSLNNLTVSCRLNSGRHCSFSKFSGFCVRCFNILLYIKQCNSCNNKTDGNNVHGKTLFSMFLSSQTFDSCSARAFLALNNSSLNNFLWKLCTAVGSKQPLFGILNFKNFRITSAER